MFSVQEKDQHARGEHIQKHLERLEQVFEKSQGQPDINREACEGPQ